ncbi:Transcription factor 1 [Paramyrothecium foliicola]|nr:Transcription factor 1 [Paramyrothecium foliicola]
MLYASGILTSNQLAHLGLSQARSGQARLGRFGTSDSGLDLLPGPLPMTAAPGTVANMDFTDNAAEGPKRHACHCGKSFLRKEHLRRHQASHAEPAFSCSVCKRSFTRSDLLRRHVALHDASTVPEFRRGRACDACHSNKTKCDGGAQCTLCTKRGISCTYNRGAASSASKTPSPTLQGVPTDVPALSSSSSATGDFSDGSIGGAPEVLSAPVIGSPDPTLLLSQAATLENLMSEANREAGIRTATAGLGIVLKQVMAHRSGQTSPRATSTPEVGAWLTTRIDACFGSFHDRWPLLHAPTFEPTGRSASLVATMAVIGSWLTDDKSTRNLAVEIHNNLVQQLLEDILRIDLDPKARWPMETYAAALFNIIFAIESGRDYLIPKAKLLQSLLQTALRGQGILDPEAVAYQTNTYYPGDFVPWVLTNNERWKRLILITFKADAYLSLLTNDPPTLRLEELGLGQISTTAIWNAHGLDVFFRRWPCEPHDRTQYRLCDMAASTFRNAMPSVVLVEDIQHSMLGLIPDVWALGYARQNYGTLGPNHNPIKDIICGQLDLCQDQLNRIVGLLANTGIQSQPAEALLGAYSCKEEPGHRNWKEDVKARIYSHVLIATALYHLLNMYLYADLSAIKAAFAQPANAEAVGMNSTPFEQRKQQIFQRWADSTDGRVAVAHAISCLAAYQRAVAGAEARGDTVDPMLHTALISSAMVVWAWMTYSEGACHCSPSMQQADLELKELYIQRSIELENWVIHWNPLSLSGVPLCKCSRSCWMGRFVNALHVGARTWELSGAINALGSKLGPGGGVPTYAPA